MTGTVSTADFHYVSSLVRDRSAIVLEPGKEYLVASRLLPVAREIGAGSVAELVTRLRSAPRGPLAGRVVEAMTTNETSWFRDRAPFQMLTDEILPRIAADRPPTDRRLRIWSAASSTGQEAYSIAMLLADWLPAHPGWSASVLGTDISSQVVERARSGRYSELEVNRGLPAGRLARHFRRAGAEWQISDEIRSLTDFQVLNLAAPLTARTPFDVVFCRNVLIYFDSATRQRILAGIARVLRPTGFLVLGAAETTLNIQTAFERLQFGRASCHRLRGSGEDSS